MSADLRVLHAGALIDTYIVRNARQMSRMGVTATEVGLPLDSIQGDATLEAAGSVRIALGAVDIAVPVIHAEFGEKADLSAADPDSRARAIASHLAAIEVCGVFGARILVTHAGHHATPEEEPAAAERSADSIAELLPLAEDVGVTLAVENLPPGHVLSSAEAVRDFLARIDHPKVRACLDTGHANITGNAPDAVATMAPHLITLHCHDNDGTADQHLMPGTGTVDWTGFGAALREAGYAGPALLELRLPEGYTASRMTEEFLSLVGSG